MYTIKLSKTVLSAYENKRFWRNAYESYGYGHPDIQKYSGANGCTALRFNCPDVYKVGDEIGIIPDSNDDIGEGDVDVDVFDVDNDIDDEENVDNCNDIDKVIVADTLCMDEKRGVKRRLDNGIYYDSKRK